MHRELNNENVLVELDGGGGFLEICLSTFDITSLATSNTGKGFAKRFKDSGVKNVMIIGITPDVPENDVNLKKLWKSIGLDRLQRSFTIATDLKLCNILLGLMSHLSLLLV